MSINFFTTLNNVNLGVKLMKTHLSVFALFAILIVSIGMAPAFGQIQDSIVVTTDKASYSEGEIILITGEVRDLFSGVPVAIMVVSPNNNIVTIAQVTVGVDKKYSTEITAGGTMKMEGTYKVSVTYGNESRTAETTFEFGGVEPIIEEKRSLLQRIADFFKKLFRWISLLNSFK